MSMCLLEVAMCKKCRSSHFQSEEGGRVKSLRTGAEFSTGVENMVVVGGGGSSKFDGVGISQYMGGLQILLKNTYGGVHLQACKPANLLKVNFFTHIFQGF